MHTAGVHPPLWGHLPFPSPPPSSAPSSTARLQGLHEAFSYVYFMHEERTHAPPPEPRPPTTPHLPRRPRHDGRARLERPVFHKDFPYHSIDHLKRDPDYLLGQDQHLLIRDPEEAVLSHANVHPDVTPATLGYAEQARLFDFHPRAHGARRPLVVNAADLADVPEGPRIAGTTARSGHPPRAGCHLLYARPLAAEWSDPGRLARRRDRASSGIGNPSRKYRFSYADKPHLRDYVDHCRPFLRASRPIPHHPREGGRRN